MTTQNKNAPTLRFPEFDDDWASNNLRNLSINGFSNGVFNDPRKVGKGYKLINVKDMYVGDSIDINTLTLVNIEEKEFKKNKVEFGDIFFTRSSLVKEGIAHSNVNLSYANDITFDGHIIRMRPDTKEISPKFLAYLLKTSTARKQLVAGGKTTTMTTIGQEEVGKVGVSFPSLPEQQKIAAFLTAVDEKIQQLTKKKDLLEQYKKGVMQKIFNQEIRFKDDNENDFTDWEEKKLGEICEVAKSGGTPTSTKSEYYDGDIPFLAISDITTQGKYLRYTSKNISKLGLENSSSWIIPMNTIIYSMYASVGFVSISKIPLATSQAVLNLILKKEINVEFIYYSLVQFQSRTTKFVMTGTQGNLNAQTVRGFEIKLPCITEQTKIADFLSAIDDKINLVNQQLEKTKEYKKGLLQKMFI